MTQPPRLSFDDALLIWRAREVHRVQGFLVGLVTLYVVLTLFTFLVMGRWYIGVLILGCQWAIWRALRWGLRWALRQGRRWWQARYPSPRKGPYANDH